MFRCGVSSVSKRFVCFKHNIYKIPLGDKSCNDMINGKYHGICESI